MPIERKFSAVCDVCQLRHTSKDPSINLAAFVAWLHNQGWQIGETTILCPRCRPQEESRNAH